MINGITVENTHYIKGRAHIEATQRGYIIWVRTNKRSKAQLTDANENYDDVCAAVTSINRGRWVSRRVSKNVVFRVYGRKLTWAKA